MFGWFRRVGRITNTLSVEIVRVDLPGVGIEAGEEAVVGPGRVVDVEDERVVGAVAVVVGVALFLAPPIMVLTSRSI